MSVTALAMTVCEASASICVGEKWKPEILAHRVVDDEASALSPMACDGLASPDYRRRSHSGTVAVVIHPLAAVARTGRKVASRVVAVAQQRPSSFQLVGELLAGEPFGHVSLRSWGRGSASYRSASTKTGCASSIGVLAVSIGFA